MLLFTFALLLLVANGAPLLAGHWLRNKSLQSPIDAGYCYRDGKRLLGESKTWLGLLASVLATLVAASILQFSLTSALLLALLAMLGDILSSFTKRRLGYCSGMTVPVLDQLPESLLPMLAMALLMPLTALQVLLPVLLFILVHIVLTECLSALHFHPKQCR